MHLQALGNVGFDDVHVLVMDGWIYLCVLALVTVCCIHVALNGCCICVSNWEGILFRLFPWYFQ